MSPPERTEGVRSRVPAECQLLRVTDTLRSSGWHTYDGINGITKPPPGAIEIRDVSRLLLPPSFPLPVSVSVSRNAPRVVSSGCTRCNPVSDRRVIAGSENSIESENHPARSGTPSDGGGRPATAAERPQCGPVGGGRSPPKITRVNCLHYPSASRGRLTHISGASAFGRRRGEGRGRLREFRDSCFSTAQIARNAIPNRRRHKIRASREQMQRFRFFEGTLPVSLRPHARNFVS